MFADIYSMVSDYIAVLLTGFVIKLVDDYLDQEYDLLNGKSSLAHRLGLGTAAYGILLFATAVAFNWKLGVALFFAGYITGMVCDLSRSFVSGLSGLQEIILVTVIGCWLVDIRTILASIFILLVIQVADDWLDIRRDYKAGQSNLFIRFGLVETWCLGLLFILIACSINLYLALLVLTASPVVILSAKHFERKGMIE
mgnify:CR=1 FL=1